MRILIWNMGNGFGSTDAKHERAWEYLLQARDRFDVALLQETREPGAFADHWSSVIWRPKYAAGSRRPLWGSAVIARTLELEAVDPDEKSPWLRDLPGSTAIARSSGDPTWFASVHLHSQQLPAELLERLGTIDVPISTPNKTVWEMDVIPWELRRLFGDETFVWGGDLNSAEGMDDVKGRFVGGNRQLRANWRAAGSLDLRLRFHDEEQHTFFSPPRAPYQLDHVFADGRTEARVVAWEVNRDPATGPEAYSDHAPIFVELAPLE